MSRKMQKKEKLQQWFSWIWCGFKLVWKKTGERKLPLTLYRVEWIWRIWEKCTQMKESSQYNFCHEMSKCWRADDFDPRFGRPGDIISRCFLNKSYTFTNIENTETERKPRGSRIRSEFGQENGLFANPGSVFSGIFSALFFLLFLCFSLLSLCFSFFHHLSFVLLT